MGANACDRIDMTVRASVARWVTAMPSLLGIGLALAATAAGLSVSERSLYRQLGFPRAVGHTRPTYLGTLLWCCWSALRCLRG